jgi:hypothetical protein
MAGGGYIPLALRKDTQYCTNAKGEVRPDIQGEPVLNPYYEAFTQQGGSPFFTRLEMEQQIRNRLKNKMYQRWLAKELGAPDMAVLGRTHIQILHFVLDKLVERGEVLGSVLGGMDFSREETEHDAVNFAQRFAVLLTSGQTIVPEEGEGIEMSNIQQFMPVPGAPQNNGQPQQPTYPAPGYAPAPGGAPQMPYQQPPQQMQPNPGMMPGPGQMPQQPMPQQQPQFAQPMPGQMPQPGGMVPGPGMAPPQQAPQPVAPPQQMPPQQMQQPAMPMQPPAGPAGAPQFMPQAMVGQPPVVPPPDASTKGKSRAKSEDQDLKKELDELRAQLISSHKQVSSALGLLLRAVYGQNLQNCGSSDLKDILQALGIPQ